MPRFVVLAHDWPVPHFDLMLEDGPMLLTWRLAESPQTDRIVPAERIADHRLEYLDYEGPLSGGRGAVRRWDAGTFVWIARTSDECSVRFEGATAIGIGKWVESECLWTFTR